MKKTINWREVQEYYDNDPTWRDVTKFFKITNYILSKAIKEKLIIIRTRSDTV